MSFYICNCGAWPITRKNIDSLYYFDLCDTCQRDYDKLADKLHSEAVDGFIKEEEEEIEIPEFWMDEE